mgnify:CR=1 FL=1
MGDDKGKDLTEYLRPDVSDTGMKKVPSLPQLKPHFIVKEYCGRARRESQTLYLEDKINTQEIDDNKEEKQNNKRSGGFFERAALIGGAVVGGALGIYVFSSGTE